METVVTVLGSVNQTGWRYWLNGENDKTGEALQVGNDSFSFQYGYDDLGNVDLLTYPSSRVVAFVNDAFGRAISVPGYINDASYHPSGALERLAFANGQTMTMTLNARQFPETLVTEANGVRLLDLAYGYDLNDNVASVSDAFFGGKTLGYDGVDRLTVADGPWGVGNIQYDDNDNILSKSMGSQIIDYTYGVSNNRLQSTSGYKNYSFAYDAHGNVTSNGATSFTYDHANNLVTSGTNTYLYDGFGRRVVADRGGDRQFYAYSSGGTLLHRFRESSQQTTDYIYLAGQLVARHDQNPGPGQAATPVFSTAQPGPFVGSVEITMGSTTAGAMIRYTTDGSEPTLASETYLGPITLNRNTLLRAVAYAQGALPSPIGEYDVKVHALPPTFSPDGGTHVSSVTISIDPVTPGSVIYYTTDGTTPTTGSPAYIGSFSLSSSSTVKAIAVAPNMEPSEMASAGFTVLPIAPKPTMTIISKSSERARISISSSVPGRTIYYNVNGRYTTVYSGPFYVRNTATERPTDYTVKSWVTAPGYAQSPYSYLTFNLFGRVAK